jgi:hypothetical protein
MKCQSKQYTVNEESEFIAVVVMMGIGPLQ